MYKYSVKALPSFSIEAWISVDVVIEFSCLNAALKKAFSGFPITSAVTSAEYSKPVIKQPKKFQYSQMIKANKDKFNLIIQSFDLISKYLLNIYLFLISIRFLQQSTLTC